MATSKPTLRDVAAAAGVSPMTASNALRGKRASRNRHGLECSLRRKSWITASI